MLTCPGDQPIRVSPFPVNSFSINTYYTLHELTVADRSAGNFEQFTGAIFTEGGGTQISNSITFTDTTAPVTAPGQVRALAWKRQRRGRRPITRIFSISPGWSREPATASVLGAWSDVRAGAHCRSARRAWFNPGVEVAKPAAFTELATLHDGRENGRAGRSVAKGEEAWGRSAPAHLASARKFRQSNRRLETGLRREPDTPMCEIFVPQSD